MEALIKRVDALHAIGSAIDSIDHVPQWVTDKLIDSINNVPLAGDIKTDPTLPVRKFEKVIVDVVCGGKLYYGIQYEENGEHFVGYGTYSLEVLSRYIKEYFIPSVPPQLITCGQCRKIQIDDVFGICFCSESGRPVCVDHYCGYAERKEQDD